MTKNMKALMAGTTTLLLGMNVFATPVQAAVDGQSAAALGKAAVEQTTGTSGKGSTGKPDDQTDARVASDDQTDVNAESAKLGQTGGGAADNAEGQSGTGEGTDSKAATKTQKANDDNQGKTKDDSTSKSDDHKSANDSQSDTKEYTANAEEKTTESKEESKKIEKVNVKDFYNEDGSVNKDKLTNYIKEVAEKDPLGIAGIFHIFGNELNDNTHIAGNVATNKITAGDFGTNPNAPANLTVGDIHYIGNLDHINQINGDNKVVIFGPDIEYRSYENGSSIQVNHNGNWEKVGIPFNHIIKADQKLDIQGELDKLSKKSDEWASHTQTAGVKADFTDQNQSYIDLSGVNKKDSKYPIYVTIDASVFSQKHNITIKGISAGEDAPLIIFNVTNIKDGDLTVQTHLALEYSDGSAITGSSDSQSHANKFLWNFGTTVKNLYIGGDYHLGSILATKANITNYVNVDGNIIGNKITVNGETHRWDLVAIPPENGKSIKPGPGPDLSYDLPKLDYGTPGPDLSYDLPKLDYGTPGPDLSYDLPKLDITKPTKPDKPTNPGEDTPKPKDEIPPFPFNPAYPVIPDHNVPDNPTTPDFFKPQPKAPVPDQPVTPSFSEPKPKTPLPDAGTHSISTPNDDVETFFKAQAKAKLVSKKVSVRGKAESAKPVTATPKTMVEHANVGGKIATPQAKKLSSLKSTPQSKKAASLPQTGQKQNHIALLGLGLVLSAVALVIGFFDKTKKN